MRCTSYKTRKLTIQRIQHILAHRPFFGNHIRHKKDAEEYHVFADSKKISTSNSKNMKYHDVITNNKTLKISRQFILYTLSYCMKCM